MYKACTRDEMREIDSIAINSYQIPGVVLMENAAISCVYELEKDFSINGLKVVILCGKGNNGGDGLAIARHLYNKGAKIQVVLVSGNQYLGDSKINYDICDAMDIPMDDYTDIDEVTYKIEKADVIIDAMLGTGIEGELREEYHDVIECVNDSNKYVLSVDVPSGINSTNGDVLSVAVKATKTVTFGAYKLGMFLYPGADYTGEIVVSSISIPHAVTERYNVNVTDNGFVKSKLIKRDNNTHKGDYGKVVVIAGSVGMSGAAYLAGESALKTGAGLVTIICPHSINSALEAKTTEVMTYPVPENNGHISQRAIPEILEKISGADVILIGPGLGRDEDISALVTDVLRHSNVPVIADADALYHIAGNIGLIKECNCDLIFTPHAMEMARLVGVTPDLVEADRVNISKDFSDETGVVLLLKGHHTIVTSHDLKQYINSTGNSGMASGGSGDVLSGIIAGLVAQGSEPQDAATMGAYIHGMAGDIAKGKYGEAFMSAGNLIDAIGDAFFRILQVDK